MKRIVIKPEKNQISYYIKSRLLNFFSKKNESERVIGPIYFYKYTELSPLNNYVQTGFDRITKFKIKSLQKKIKKYQDYTNRLYFRKFSFYLLSILFLPLCVLSILFYFYIKNSIFFSVVLGYEYKILSLENIINIDSEDNNLIVSLTAEEGVTISEYTTGVKIVGEKAFGKISVFNATAEIVVINSGTKIVCISSSCNGKEYLAKDNLNIGPGSASDLEIIASEIGDDYNIAVNAGRFKIGNFNPNYEVVASNIRPIQGGTPKKTVMYVSKEDIERLKLKAQEELKSVIKSKIVNDPNNSNNYIFFQNTEVLLNTDDIIIEGDKEGDEKDIFNITLKGSGKINAIDRHKILPKVDELKKNMIPEGYYIDEKTFTYTVNPVYKKNIPMLEFKLNGVARLFIDVNFIRNQIRHKTLIDAIRFLQDIPNVKLIDFTYSPDFIPEKLRLIPDDINRIRIQIIALDPNKSSFMYSENYYN